MEHKSHTIGARAHVSAWGLLWGGIVMIVIAFGFQIGFTALFDWEIDFGFWMILGFFFFPIAGTGLAMILYDIPRIQNNKNRNPAIVLTQGGTFVLIKPNGKRFEIHDKIVSVTGHRYWRVISSYVSGNTRYTTKQETPEGNVVFILQKPDGLKYRKTVKYVMNCKETAAKISAVLK